MNFFVTGGNGFIGQRLCAEIIRRGNIVHSSIRDNENKFFIDDNNFNLHLVGDISDESTWNIDFSNIDCVIHCAARAHILHESSLDPLSTYRKVNVEYTRYLAREALRFGVRRFIYVSSIGVNGLFTHDSMAFKEIDKPAPIDDYAISKYEAEQVLQNVSCNSNLEVVIVRPPLIYGPGVKGNFYRLLGLVHSRIPLPFGLVKNKRSFIGLSNFIDFLICCSSHHSAAGQTFLVSDGVDLSTPDLLEVIARSMGVSPRMVSIPLSPLRLMCRMIGKESELERLLGSLQVDSFYARNVLNWSPVVSVETEIQNMVEWYLDHL